ncbi:MAG TPA: hypothetical protein VN380_16505 [Thermoanaerobaculia bacterium]|jgi:hypothetical protein|nr:hypothetical protein [Thermoanaerobaculia bacterium]
MSKVVTTVTAQAAPDDPVPPQTPTVTHYEQVAAKLSSAIDEALALMPDFTQSHPLTKGFVRSQQSVSDTFILSTIAAVEANPELQSVNKFDVTAAGDLLQLSDAFRPLVDKLNGAAKNVKFTIDRKRAEIVADALQTYEIAKGVARDAEATTAAEHVGNLRRDLGRSGKQKKKPAPAPAPGNTAVN